MKPILPILLAALLCGCEARIRIEQSPSPTTDPTLKTTWRVQMAGTNYRYEVYTGSFGWHPIAEKDSLEEACAAIDMQIAQFKSFKNEPPRLPPPPDTRSWSNVPPILNCDKP